MTLSKIRIEVLDKEAVDAQRLPQTFEVQFNPTQYSLSKAAQYSGETAKDRDSPLLTYTGGQSGSLSLSLLFDTTRQGGLGQGALDVRTATSLAYVRRLVRMQPRTHAPPRVLLTWGNSLSFTGVVDSVQETYSLFAPDGTPVRATAQLSLKESWTEAEQSAGMNLQSPDHTRVRRVREGDTLCSIAADEYRDPNAWRHIADANDLPLSELRRLKPGRQLRLPPLHVLGEARAR